jgi:16S rRNA (guanine966-N2)-methyltransferase
MLAPELEGTAILDLFAGTGALGLEALSRGAGSAVFVESDRRTAQLLEQNLATVGGDGQVLAMPAARALTTLTGPFDIAFLDPPYDANLLGPTLADLAARDLVRELLVCEHRGSEEPPAAPSGWTRSDARRFGDVALAFYRKKGAAL